MNEAQTRAELIEPKLKASGWGVVAGAKILREHNITAGRIQIGGSRGKALKADYVLVYRAIKLAVVEAKRVSLAVSEGIQQAKNYAKRLNAVIAYATNGSEIYSICMQTGVEALVEGFLSPDEMWHKAYSQDILSKQAEYWQDKFTAVPFENKRSTWQPRYYQEVAIRNTLQAIAQGKKRILLTLATGTGKTAIAFQIAWVLFHTRWSLSVIENRKLKMANEESNYQPRQPRILFLADRNILANQAFNVFSAFPDDAMVRITPKEIKKGGKVPTGGSIFFTIFQSFMSGKDKTGNPTPYFGEYPADYFDFIIIDECHRGGANDEGDWHGILNYFSPAVQLGLTATPKRADNVDTYRYFGEPVYTYALKEGINDGFLTPFKVQHIKTTIDEYTYESDDDVIDGEIEPGKEYTEKDFNRIIVMKERENKLVKIFMEAAYENEKTIIFCANQEHAALIRDLVNQNKKSTEPNYCVRVTANDGELGEQFLREFQDNEKSVPTVLTTSQKLSTGVDARNIRNIVLLRSVKQMIEFKQIIGRGTRLFDDKDFFTIYDFVGASQRFADPEWDGEPLIQTICEVCTQTPCICAVEPLQPCARCGKMPCICIIVAPLLCEKCGQTPCVCNNKIKIKIKLADGKERRIQYNMTTSFLNTDGKLMSVEQFLAHLFGELHNSIKSEAELRRLWSTPKTREILLEQLTQNGFDKTALLTLQKLIYAEKSDLFDVLGYVFDSALRPITRKARVVAAQKTIYTSCDAQQKEFIDFVLRKYIQSGVGELALDKLPTLLAIKYKTIADAEQILGKLKNISSLFIGFQRYLYLKPVTIS